MNRLIAISLIAFQLLSSNPQAWAGEYDIKQMTPEIQQAIQGRQSRYDELQIHKASGLLGENNQGYVEVLKNQSNAAQVANAENADRKTIYRAIVEQNHLGAQGLVQVQKVFADVQRDKARSGDMVQNSSGVWAPK